MRISLDLICYAVYICNSWLVRVHINRRQVIESHENLMGSSRYIHSELSKLSLICLVLEVFDNTAFLYCFLSM